MNIRSETTLLPPVRILMGPPSLPKCKRDNCMPPLATTLNSFLSSFENLVLVVKRVATHVSMRIRGYEMSVFRKILRTYYMNDHFYNILKKLMEWSHNINSLKKLREWSAFYVSLSSLGVFDYLSAEEVIRFTFHDPKTPCTSWNKLYPPKTKFL